MQRFNSVVLCSLLAGAGLVCAQEYTADDFSRLVRDNPIVVAGGIEAVSEGDEVKGGLIIVKEVLKNGLGSAELKKGLNLEIAPTQTNLFWAKAIIERPDGTESVWILKGEKQEEAIGPVDIVAHFLLDSASVSEMAGDNVAPVEQWGTGGEVKEHWGVIKIPKAAYYNSKGKKLGYINYGTCLDITDIKDTKAGEMAVFRKNGNTENLFIVNTSDLNIMPGELSKVDPERRKLRVEEAKTQANLEFMRDKALEANPYVSNYKRKKKIYKDYWAKIKDLEAKRNSSTGVTRDKYYNELRALKGSDIKIGADYEAAKKKYEDWISKNPRESLSNPNIKMLEDKLAEIRAKL